MPRLNIPQDHWRPLHQWHSRASRAVPSIQLVPTPAHNVAVMAMMDRARTADPRARLSLNIDRPHSALLAEALTLWHTHEDTLPEQARPGPDPLVARSTAAIVEAALDGYTQVFHVHPRLCRKCRGPIGDLDSATWYLETCPGGLVASHYAHRSATQPHLI